MPSTLSAAVLTVAILLGTAGCGGDGPDAEPPVTTATTGTTATAAPTLDPTVEPTASASTSSPALGLPDGFPSQTDVPMVPGVVTTKTGGEGPDGKKGWAIEMTAAGSQDDCFDRAAAALTAGGFTKQGEIVAGDTRQAQFTSPGYAVIISSRADGDQCQIGYEVGQVGR